MSWSAGDAAPQPAAPQAGLLQGHEDNYDGLIVDDFEAPPGTAAEFADALQGSLAAWRDKGYRGIWLKLPTTRAHYVGHAVDAGFDFHHAEQDYVMLTTWLPTDCENKLPPNASHQVGVGAFVLNERREVLVVQEKSGPLRGKGVWKMPTGLVQQGEDVTEAAEREVLEETGVRARFDAVLAMRQAHGFAWGKSDMFFVVALKLEPGPQVLQMQEDELVGVRWMPLEEYFAEPFTAARPLFKQIHAACRAYANGTYRGLHGRKLETGFSARQDLLLFGEAADRAGADEEGGQDAWIGLDAAGAGAAGGGAAGNT
ncbi:Nudix hydrolase 8 [Micractinium conductrix]|uniref:Nudix hydrolase 8 n=1 Tax=Micractinium conductrix TaxID=554055 RepID=A0A2P6VEC6_9CHLO|nr:Nudix hydrolase 8 [Micractinium conductrix]|eukprot:PSC72444.1 Nudix hydrolase 8 [Micractinium conductrix]